MILIKPWVSLSSVYKITKLHILYNQLLNHLSIGSLTGVITKYNIWCVDGVWRIVHYTQHNGQMYTLKLWNEFLTRSSRQHFMFGIVAVIAIGWSFSLITQYFCKFGCSFIVKVLVNDITRNKESRGVTWSTNHFEF